MIRSAAAIDETTALRVGARLVVEDRRARIDGGRVSVRVQRRLGAILLTSTPARPEAAEVARAFTAHLREHGLDVLTWGDAAESLRRRLGLIHRVLGAPWPAMDDASLLAGLDDWLGPQLAALRPGDGLADLDVVGALRALLPWPDASRLDALAPERLKVPSGSTVRITYPRPDDAEGRPRVEVKLQECFSLAESPRLVDGRVPVVFSLLSPARRPLAITEDLESFWRGPYQQVRREMRGRYPRHPWPEDPWSATPTARTTPRAHQP